MPALIFSAFAIYIVISFLIGLLLSNPLAALIIITSFCIISAIHDYRRGSWL